jgi:protocatechuate 3,4-dioxygenase beta subunit
VLLMLAVLAAIAALIVFRRMSPVPTSTASAVREVPRHLLSMPGFRGEGVAPFVPALVSGTVRARDGKPIAGARVCGSCASCGLVDLPPSACVLTNEQGAYAFEPADARPVLVTAVAQGFNAGVANDGRPIELRGKPKSDVDVTLQPGGATLSGIVLDALGGPVAHARIQLARFDIESRPTIETQSNEEGRFEAAVSEGALLIRAEADGYAPATAHAVAPSDDVEVRLTPASRIRGRVVLARTGKPVAGAEVRAFPRAGNPRVAAALSDEHGEFVVEALEPGMYTLLAEHASARGHLDSPVAVGLADTVEDVVIEATNAVSVFGRVVLPPEAPPCRGYVALGAPTVESAALAKQALSEKEITRDYNAVPSLSSNIEADGTVSFKGVTPGRYHVNVQCSDHVLDEGPELLDVRDRDLQVIWKAQPGLGLLVRVVDAAGAPVPDARLTLLISRGGAAGPPLGMGFSVDRQGVAKLPANLYPGSYTVEANGGLEAKPVTVELRPGSGTTEVTLRVEGSGSIMVDAKDELGRPVNGLRVNALAQAAPTEAKAAPEGPAASRPRIVSARALGGGQYQIGPLPAGAYTVEAEESSNPPIRAEGPNGAVIHVASGALLRAQLSVRRDAEVRGTVVDSKGQPEANVWVSATYQTDGPVVVGPKLLRLGVEPLRAMTDPEGRFELNKLRPGARYQLRVIEPHGAAVTVDRVTPGQDVKLVLPEPSVISGVVVDAQGRPQETFTVQAHHAETGVNRVGRVGPGGSFRIEGVPAGKVALTAARPPAEFAQLELEVQGGEKRDGIRLSLAAHTETPAPSSPL